MLTKNGFNTTPNRSILMSKIKSKDTKAKEVIKWRDIFY